MGFRTLVRGVFAAIVLFSFAGCGPTLSEQLSSLAVQQVPNYKARVEQYKERFQVFIQGLTPEQAKLLYRVTVLKTDQVQEEFINSLSPDQEVEYLGIVQEGKRLEQQGEAITRLFLKAAEMRVEERAAALQAWQQIQNTQQQSQLLWIQQQQLQELQRLNNRLW
jgi:hypothetical protein